MTYYLILLVISILGIFLPIKWQRILAILMVSFMCILCSLRGFDVGTDTINYVNYSLRDVTDTFGPLYVLFRELSQLTMYPFVTFLCILAVLTYIPLAIVCYKYSDLPCLSLFLFMSTSAMYFFETFNICRQALAIMYILLAMIYYRDVTNSVGFGDFLRKNSFPVLLLLFAFFSLLYVILILPLFWLKRIQIDKKRMVVILGVSVIFGLFLSEAVMSGLISILYFVFGGSDSYLLSHLTKYSDYDYSSDYTLVGRFAHIAPYILLLIITFNKKLADNILYKMLYWGIVLLGICLSSVFSERIACTYTISIIVVIPNLMYYLSRSQKIVVALIFCYFTYRYVGDMNIMQFNDLNSPVPYKFIFSDLM